MRIIEETRKCDCCGHTISFQTNREGKYHLTCPNCGYRIHLEEVTAIWKRLLIFDSWTYFKEKDYPVSVSAAQSGLEIFLIKIIGIIFHLNKVIDQTKDFFNKELKSGFQDSIYILKEIISIYEKNKEFKITVKDRLGEEIEVDIKKGDFKINQLRNDVVHKGYIPEPEEAKKALGEAENYVYAIKKYFNFGVEVGMENTIVLLVNRRNLGSKYRNIKIKDDKEKFLKDIFKGILKKRINRAKTLLSKLNNANY